jgi:hypothetical protein
LPSLKAENGVRLRGTGKKGEVQMAERDPFEFALTSSLNNVILDTPDWEKRFEEERADFVNSNPFSFGFEPVPVNEYVKEIMAKKYINAKDFFPRYADYRLGADIDSLKSGDADKRAEALARILAVRGKIDELTNKYRDTEKTRVQLLGEFFGLDKEQIAKLDDAIALAVGGDARIQARVGDNAAAAYSPTTLQRAFLKVPDSAPKPTSINNIINMPSGGYTFSRPQYTAEVYFGVKRANPSAVSVTMNFAEGVGDAFKSAGEGLWNIVTDPGAAARGLVQAVTNPRDTLKAIRDDITASYEENVVNGNADTKAKFVGRATGEIALVVFGPKGFDKAVKTVRIGEGATEASILAERASIRASAATVTTNAGKGALGEAAADLTFARAGYTKLPSKMGANQGFDGVYIKYGKNGEIQDIIINESKFNTSQLSKTVDGSKQMSKDWINNDIQECWNQKILL